MHQIHNCISIPKKKKKKNRQQQQQCQRNIPSRNQSTFAPCKEYCEHYLQQSKEQEIQTHQPPLATFLNKTDGYNKQHKFLHFIPNYKMKKTPIEHFSHPHHPWIEVWFFFLKKKEKNSYLDRENTQRERPHLNTFHTQIIHGVKFEFFFFLNSDLERERERER